MFRKITNKSLLIIFAILAIVVVIVLVYDQHKGERSFKNELFKVDSSAVTSVTIYSKGSGKDFVKLAKSGKEWEVLNQGKRYPADSGSIKNMLQSLAHITAERVAGTEKSDWKTFEITDSLSTRVVVEEGKIVSADFRVGKISFSQDRSMQGYGGQRNMQVKSHIRVPDDERIYVVDGFLSMLFTATPDHYRNRTLLKLDKSRLTKLTFTYPGDSSFVLSRNGSKWVVDGLPADSAATEKYLNSIVNAMGNEFADQDIMIPDFRYTLKIEGNNMSQVEISGAVVEGAKRYYLKSSVNPSSLFGSSSPGLFNQIFAGKRKFLSGKFD